MGFSDFKASRKKMGDVAKKMKEQDKKPSYNDDRMWNITQDSAGNGSAIIRFLPQKDVEKVPFQLVYNHGIKRKGRWLIETCPVNIAEKCPICDYSSSIYDTDKTEGGKYWRKKYYYSNILVVKDPKHPENEGKVFIFRFGKKIYEKLMNKIAPEQDELGIEIPAVNVHDLWEGMDFVLKICKVDGNNNYDASEFLQTIKPVATTDEGIEEIYNQLYDMDEFIAADKIKSFEELEKKLKSFLGAKTEPKAEGKEKDKAEGTETPKAKEEKEDINIDDILNNDDIPDNFDDIDLNFEDE